MTHKSIPDETRKASGVSDGLIRLSVGIEDAEDLIEDLKQALKKVKTVVDHSGQSIEKSRLLSSPNGIYEKTELI